MSGLKWLFIFFLLCSFFILGYSQNNISFTNYDFTNGLPLDEITIITEDSLGFIWLGGPLGLAKFDGKNFSHYYRDSPGYNIAGNVVRDISITPSGEIVVVFDDNGISVYNHVLDSFRNKVYSKNDGESFPQHSIFCVHALNDSIVYMGANREKGLFRVNINSFESTRIPMDKKIYDISINPQDSNTLLFSSNGLYRYHIESQIAEQVGNLAFDNIIIRNQAVWVDNYFQFINKYEHDFNHLTRYDFKEKLVIGGSEFVNNKLWAGLPKGIGVLDTSTLEITHITSGQSKYSLAGNFIYHIFKDSFGRAWVSSDGGLSVYDPSKTYFEDVKFLNKQTTYLTKLDNNNLLSLNFYSGIDYHFENNIDAIETPSNLKEPVETITHENKTLIRFFNGLGILDLKNKNIQAYSSPFTKSESRGLVALNVENNMFSAAYIYSNLFISWNKMDNTLDTIVLSGEPRGLIKTPDDNIWIFGMGVFLRYNNSTKEHKSYSFNNEQYKMLAGDIVSIDKRNNEYWISTRINGVWKARYENGSFIIHEKYNESKGLRDNNIKETHVDQDDNLFILSTGGLFIYNEATDQFIQLGQKNDFNIRTTYNLASIDSIVYVLGNTNKKFDLRQINDKEDKPKVLLNYMSINGKDIERELNKEIHLKHNQNNLSIGYSIISFHDPSNTKIRYRIQESKEWYYPQGYLNEIHLSALRPSEYKFEISVKAGNGKWTEPRSARFSISPPWWKSWWFLLTSLILGIIFFYVLYKLRIGQLKKINSMNLKLKELESESLRAQMNPHFVFNALNSIKAYIIKNEKEAAADYLTAFSELMRAVLNNSKQKEISLSQEIEALKLYLQIENLRLKNVFDYEIDIDRNINPESIFIPPLIIQPFVENSIWHGFLNKPNRGKLSIDINKEEDDLLISIIDNGIGREASRKIEFTRTRKRSYGIAITKTRLENIISKTDVEIIDLYKEDGKSDGTKVDIRLPYKTLKNG